MIGKKNAEDVFVGMAIIYLVARFIPWAAHGFPVAGR